MIDHYSLFFLEVLGVGSFLRHRVWGWLDQACLGLGQRSHSRGLKWQKRNPAFIWVVLSACLGEKHGRRGSWGDWKTTGVTYTSHSTSTSAAGLPRVLWHGPNSCARGSVQKPERLIDFDYSIQPTGQKRASDLISLKMAVRQHVVAGN